MPIKSTIRIDGGKKRKEKNIKKNLQNNSKNKNSKYFSWVTAVRVLSRTENHSPPHLPRVPSYTLLISGPTVGAAQILIWSYSCVSWLQCPQLSELLHFLLWELSVAFYIFHKQNVRLVDHVDLISSLHSWWEGFGSSLATLPLGFNCGFIFTSACGSPTGV